MKSENTGPKDIKEDLFFVRNRRYPLWFDLQL